jgi:hypothetical protein
MTARSVIEHALTVYYDGNTNLVQQILADYDAEALHEAANRLHTECGQQADRQLFSDGIHHASGLVRQWANEAQEKATSNGVQPSAGAATPGPTGRVAQLLDAIRTRRGRWNTNRAAQLYRDSHIEPPDAQWSRTRTVARGDLRDLHAWGHLVLHDEPSNRHYTLSFRKDRP